MLVGDLVYSDDFDMNCGYRIYDASEEGNQWRDGAPLIWNSNAHGWKRPCDLILDMKIAYITTDDGDIIIEAKH